MQRIKVAVLRGGPGAEHDVSLKTGKSILENLSDKYIPIDVFVAKDRTWYLDGIAIAPGKLSKHIDVVFNALHGEYGEDGKVQQLMNNLGVRYTGSEALASALGMNKLLSKEIFNKYGFKTPLYKVIKKGDKLDGLDQTIFKTFPMPAIIKPAGSGSSMGVSLARDMKDILPGIMKAFKYSDVVIVEEFIKGKEATCGVVENFRGEPVYSLLPLKINKSEEYGVFDYDEKYSLSSNHVSLGNFSSKEKEMIQSMAKAAHKTLGLRHYSRSDFIVSPKRGVYILEVNTLPELTKKSSLSKSLEAVGSSMTHFLDHVITLALG